ncbi:MAG TPA: hypothetical protein PK977_06100, partial [Chitinophagaceae bacterium]|nr:hypothetical protein [Chitinophagaceae bacterium]
MKKFIHSRLVRWMLLNGLFFLLLLTILRIIFHFVFTPRGEKAIGDALWMGFRYDARVVCVFLMIVLLLSSIFYFYKPFTQVISRKILLVFTRLFGLLVIVVYTF